MDFLLYGPDIKLRDQALAAIKKEVLADGEASGSLDFESLDAIKLTPEKLKIALLSMPGVSRQRLVHVYRAEKLAKECLELLLAFLKQDHAHMVLVLEADEWDAGTKLRGEVTKFLKKTGVESAAAVNVFDMMNLVAAADQAAALRALKKLFTSDEAPERLLGGMVWAWSNRIQSRVSSGVYKKGLLVLQEADIALKRSHFPNREYALEVAVVKLSLFVQPSKV